MSIFRKIRQKDLKRVLWVLVIVIVPAFMLWGANWFVKAQRNFVGVMYGRKVGGDEYETFLRNTQVLFLLGFGQNFLEKMSQEQITSYVWQSLLMIEKAKREKIKVSDEELARKIQSLGFLNSQGGFSKERYLAILKNLRVVPGQFEEFVKKMLMADKLRQMILSDIGVSDEELRDIYEREKQEAKIRYIFLDFEKEKAKLAPTREELEAFFAADPERFRIPAKVKIAYILIKEGTPETLKKIQSQIEMAADIEATAAEFGLEVKESSFFGQEDPIEGLGWQDEIVQNAFLLEEGQTAGPFTTTEGTVFFKKTGHKESYLPKFSEVADKVKEALVSAKAQAKTKELSEKIIAAIDEKGIDDLNKVKEFFPGIEVDESDYFGRGDYVEKIGLSPEFNERVFALKEGEILKEALKLQKGFCIVQLVERKPIDEALFEKEKEEYRAKILQAKQMIRMNAYLAELVKESKLTVRNLNP